MLLQGIINKTVYHLCIGSHILLAWVFVCMVVGFRQISAAIIFSSRVGLNFWRFMYFLTSSVILLALVFFESCKISLSLWYQV